MLRAIWRKALADTRSHPLQSVLIVIILVAASTALALSLIVQQNASKPWQRSFDEANGAHLQFFGEQPIDPEPIQATGAVAEMSAPVPMASLLPLIDRGQKYETNVFGFDVEPPAIARPLIDRGRWLAADATDDIVLERSFADEVGIDVGDEVQFKVGDELRTLTVVGIAIDTGRGAYPDWKPGHAWVRSDTLGQLVPDESQLGSAIFVRLNEPDDVEAMLSALRSVPISDGPVHIIDWKSAQEDLNEWNEINSVFLGVFSAFALVAVGLIIANAISGRILAQHREIGILKATGFTPRQVAGIYVVQHLGLALVASLIGLGLAAIIAPIYLERLWETFNATAGNTFDPLLAIITVVVILTAVTIFTLWPAIRAGRVPTVKAITTGFTPVGTQPSRLASLARRLRLPMPIVVGVKDAFSRPWRATLTVAALSLTIMTLTFTLGIDAMLNQMLDDRGLIEEPWDIEIVRAEADDATIREILDANPNVISYVTSSNFHATLPGQDIRRDGGFELRALGGDIESSGYPLIDGRMPTGPGEAIVGRVLFDELGLRIGDELTVSATAGRFSDQPTLDVPLTIVGTYVEPEEDGNVALVTVETMTALIPDLQPSTYEIMMRDDNNWDQLLIDVQAATAYEVNVDLRERGTPNEITMIRSIMYGLCAVLLIIGAANVLTTMLLNVRERSRDIGIFKAIGMTPRQIVGSVASATGLLTVLALVVGIPLGMIVFRVLFVLVGENMAGADPALYAAPPLAGVALIVPSAIVFAVLCSVLPAQRAASVQVSDVLRHE